MTTAKYIALDCETGGVTTDKSLLTVCFIVYDERFNRLDTLNLAIKPDDGEYRVTAEALKINHIDLATHDQTAITQSKAGGALREFLKKHSEDGKVKLIPVGHNVYFDLVFIWDNLLGKLEFQKYTSYRILDTGVVGQFLKTCGFIPDSVSGSLQSFVKHYGGQVIDAHTAEGDTLMTVDVLVAMIHCLLGAG